jgi:hypothetical protein
LRQLSACRHSRELVGDEIGLAQRQGVFVWHAHVMPEGELHNYLRWGAHFRDSAPTVPTDALVVEGRIGRS